jgi:hypothetical protein
MAEVTNELIYEVLKAIQQRLSNMDAKLGEIDGRMNALTLHSLGVQTDIKNIYAAVAQTEIRLDHIERRLGLVVEPAE